MVYIDSANIPYRGMLMCHMIADTTEELLTMVDKIGVKRKWIQYPGTPKEHFDICQAKKKLALKFGAKEIDGYELARIMNLRKGNPMRELQQKWDKEDGRDSDDGASR